MAACITIEDTVSSFDTDAYFTDEEQDLKELREKLSEIYRIRIRQSLQLAGKSEEKVAKYTDDILLEGLEIYPNSRVCKGVYSDGLEIYPTVNDGTDEAKAKHLAAANTYGRVFNHEIRDRHFLHLNIPSKTEERGLMDDHAVRNYVFANFIKNHKGIDEKASDNVTTNRTVHNFDSIEKEIRQFLDGPSARCMEATVIFNAHGCNEGLLFNEGNPNPAATDKITKVIEQIIAEKCIETIVRLKLIYTHCRGYMTAKDTEDGSKIQVKLLTSGKNEDTKNTVIKIKKLPSPGGIRGRYDIIDAWMVELNRLAADEPERPELPGGRGDGPSTQMEESMEVGD